MDSFKVCSTCGGEYDKRFTDTPCPECGKMYGKNKKTELESVDEVRFNSAMDTLEIPEEYRKVKWSKSILLKNNADKLSDRSFAHYADQLSKAHDIFDSGRLPNISAIIIAPPKMSKLTWAYSCMQLALANGYSTSWLLDTQEVKRLLVLGGDNPKYELYNKINYDSYIMSDALFVTVTKTYARGEAYSVILELLDKRARKGLPTFFISRFDLKQLSRRDYDNQFEFVKDYTGKENNLKYPAIIQWSDIFGKNTNVKESSDRLGSVKL